MIKATVSLPQLQNPRAGITSHFRQIQQKAQHQILYMRGEAPEQLEKSQSEMLMDSVSQKNSAVRKLFSRRMHVPQFDQTSAFLTRSLNDAQKTLDDTREYYGGLTKQLFSGMKYRSKSSVASCSPIRIKAGKQSRAESQFDLRESMGKIIDMCK